MTPPRTGVPGTLTAGVDIGGTKMLAGVVDAHGRVLDRARRETPAGSAGAVEDAVVSIVEEFAAGHAIAAVGIGAAGFVDTDRTTVRFAPHVAWHDEPIRAALAHRLGLPVAVDNDANVAGLAEARLGAGKGHRFVVCVTVGTGLGGALVVDGRVYRGANGMAGEFGHMQVVPDGLPCRCGNRGCWEQYASGSALARAAHEMVLRDVPAAHALRELTGAAATALTGALVTDAARAGDPLALDLVGDMGRWLGEGLADLAAAFDPHCIVIGGGVSEAADMFLPRVRETFARQLVGRGHRDLPVILPAALGADAGFIGAAEMARELAGR